MWRTWLIFRRTMDGATERRLREDFGVSDRTDLAARPLATLDFLDGRAELRTENVARSHDRFFDQLDKYLKGTASSVRALSFAPFEQLAALHGSGFWFRNRWYEVTWDGAKTSVDTEPYARRFISIAKSRTRVPEDLNAKMIASRWDGLGESPLILMPDELLLDDKQARAAITFENDETGMEKGIWFLPPLRSDEHPDRAGPAENRIHRRSYLSAEYLRGRALMREAVGADQPRVEEPVAILVQRMVDEPALRDLLLDGGGVRVEGEAGPGTQLALEVCGERGDLARNRADIMLGKPAHGPEWAQQLARELRRDVASIIPGGVVRHGGSQRVEWAMAHADMAQPVTQQDGAWHRLDQLCNSLCKQTGEVKDRSLLWKSVLRLTNPGDRYNHDAALRLFADGFWRLPWGSDADSEQGWLRATNDLLDNELGGLPLKPEQRGESWEHTVGRNEKGFSVSYAGDPSRDTVLQWRLLYPIGTVVNARTVYLNRANRSLLNSRLVLA